MRSTVMVTLSAALSPLIWKDLDKSMELTENKNIFEGKNETPAVSEVNTILQS